MDMSQIPDTLKGLEVDIHLLRPYLDNPNNGDTDAIKESLQAHGQYRPIVVRAGVNEILAGNHTYAAALELGWKTIACTFVECDDDEARRIVIADNRTARLGWWDVGYMSQLLSGFKASPKGFKGTGYSDLSADKLLSQQDLDLGPLVVTDPKPVQEVRRVTITMDSDRYEELKKWVKELKGVFKTTSTSDTILLALRESVMNRHLDGK